MSESLEFLCILFKIKKEDITYDWLGFQITDNNKITTHHLVKKEMGGENDANNVAILSDLSHRYLHEQIEVNAPDIYDEITIKLKEINMSRRYPTLEECYELIKYFEEYEKRCSKKIKKNLKITCFNEKLLKKLPKDLNVYNPTDYRKILQMGINPVYKNKSLRKKIK